MLGSLFIDLDLWKNKVECSKQVRALTPSEKNGNHILFTIRTTASFHSKRLPVLFQTWLATVNRSNVVIVTDGHDPVLQYRAEEAGTCCVHVHIVCFLTVNMQTHAILVYHKRALSNQGYKNNILYCSKRCFCVHLIQSLKSEHLTYQDTCSLHCLLFGVYSKAICVIFWSSYW